MHRVDVAVAELQAEVLLVGHVGRHAELAFRALVVGLELVVAERPVAADAVARAHLEVGGEHPQAGAQPVHRRAARRAQVVARERQRPLLDEVAAVARRAAGRERHDVEHGRVRGVPAGRVGRVRHLAGRREVVVDVRLVVGPRPPGRGPGLQHEHAAPGRAQLRGDERPGRPGAHHDDVVVGHRHTAGGVAHEPKPGGFAPVGCAPMARPHEPGAERGRRRRPRRRRPARRRAGRASAAASGPTGRGTRARSGCARSGRGPRRRGSRPCPRGRRRAAARRAPRRRRRAPAAGAARPARAPQLDRAEAGERGRQGDEALERRAAHAGTGNEPRHSEATGAEVNVCAAYGARVPISAADVVEEALRVRRRAEPERDARRTPRRRAGRSRTARRSSSSWRSRGGARRAPRRRTRRAATGSAGARSRPWRSASML